MHCSLSLVTLRARNHMEVQAEPQEKNAAARGGFGGQVLTARKGDAVSIPVTETQKHCG